MPTLETYFFETTYPQIRLRVSDYGAERIAFPVLASDATGEPVKVTQYNPVVQCAREEIKRYSIALRNPFNPLRHTTEATEERMFLWLALEKREADYEMLDADIAEILSKPHHRNVRSGGAKPISDVPRVHVTLSLDADLLDEMKSKKGDLSLSEYTNRALREALKKEE